MPVFKRYYSFQKVDLQEAAYRFNTYFTLAHQADSTDLHGFLKIQATRP